MVDRDPPESFSRRRPPGARSITPWGGCEHAPDWARPAIAPDGLRDGHAAPVRVADGDAALAAVDRQHLVSGRIPHLESDAAFRTRIAPGIFGRGLTDRPISSRGGLADQVLVGLVEKAELVARAVPMVIARPTGGRGAAAGHQARQDAANHPLERRPPGCRARERPGELVEALPVNKASSSCFRTVGGAAGASTENPARP